MWHFRLRKTQLVLEYISRARDKFSAILWIDAAAETNIKRSFDSCANRICLEYRSFQDHVKDLESRFVVERWLRTPIYRDWLLVVDSMDDLNQNKDLCTLCRGLVLGAICITSTNDPSNFETHGFNPIALARLDLVASQSVLLWRALDTDQDPGEDGKSCSSMSLNELDS